MTRSMFLREVAGNREMNLTADAAKRYVRNMRMSLTAARAAKLLRDAGCCEPEIRELLAA